MATIDDAYTPEPKDLTPLVEAMKEYQKLLCDELDEVVGVAHVHGWKSSRHEEGKRLREKIDKLKKEFNYYG